MQRTEVRSVLRVVLFLILVVRGEEGREEGREGRGVCMGGEMKEK